MTEQYFFFQWIRWNSDAIKIWSYGQNKEIDHFWEICARRKSVDFTSNWSRKCQFYIRFVLLYLLLFNFSIWSKSILFNVALNNYLLITDAIFIFRLIYPFFVICRKCHHHCKSYSTYGNARWTGVCSFETCEMQVFDHKVCRYSSSSEIIIDIHFDWYNFSLFTDLFRVLRTCWSTMKGSVIHWMRWCRKILMNFSKKWKDQSKMQWPKLWK